MYKSNGKQLHTAALTQMALCITLLCISSYLIIPIPFTPVVLSMHTIAVNVIGLLFSPRHAAITVLVYLIMGFIGIPVFAGGTAGADKLFGPTGGFYFGFLLAAVCISLLKGKKPQLWRYMLITLCVSIPIQHVFAVFFMAFYQKIPVLAAAAAASFPFLPGDILKCIGASVISIALKKQIH